MPDSRPENSAQLAKWLKDNGYLTADTAGTPWDDFQRDDDIGVLWVDSSEARRFLGVLIPWKDRAWDFALDNEGRNNREVVKALAKKLQEIGLIIKLF